MATVIKRSSKSANGQTKEKKFKNFKLRLEFTERADAVNFADLIASEYPEIAEEVRELAYK